jgi:hypothetical protein
MNMIKQPVVIVWVLIIANILSSETYYVSPDGNDNYSGSRDNPFASIQEGHDRVQPGDTLYLRGGTYYPSARTNFTKDGGTDSYYVVLSFPGELPIIDGENIPDGNINHGSTTTWAFNNANYWKIIGPIKLTNGRGAGVYIEGGNLEFKLIESCYNGKRASRAGHGFIVWEGNSVLFNNCDAHHNANHLWKDGEAQADNQYQHGDGWRIFNATNMRLQGCRSWHNLDDNYDFLGVATPITLIDSWAAYAGIDDAEGSITGEPNRRMPPVDHREIPAIWGNGIKLGYAEDNVSHQVIRCLTWGNNGAGFHMNLGPSYIVNSASFGNYQFGFDYLDGNKHEIYNTFEFDNNLDTTFADSVDYPIVEPDLSQHSHNSWDSTLTITITFDDFISVSDSGMFGTRQEDGSLPITPFLRLASESELIDAGIDVGLPFIGDAPDLGAFEYNDGTTSLAQKISKRVPQDFNLTSYPNPFNPRATVHYDIPRDGDVDVAIYDISGRKVIQLDQGYHRAGTHTLSWDATDTYGRQVASGMYLLRIQAGNQVKTIKMTYLR